MTGRRLLLALVTAMSMTGVAEAQSKYYMRSRIAPLKETPSKPSCGVPATGNWVANKPGTSGAAAIKVGPALSTPELAQAWCNEQTGITSANMCLWIKDANVYLAINSIPTGGYPETWGSSSCQ